jgi:hypothetical protein
MAIRAKFFILAEASADRKTNVILIKTIQLYGDTAVYEFPPNQQSCKEHPKLIENTVIKNGIKSIVKRGQYRNLIITLTTDLKAIYLDEENNVCFNGEYLNEIQPFSTATQPRLPDIPNPSPRSLASLVKDMVLDKFTGRNQNAQSWITIFSRECVGMKIENAQKIDALRLFLEGVPTEWYATTKKLILTENWDEWENSFLDSFSEKGWSAAVHAYTFRYIGGSLAEYAIKKHNVLVEADPDLTELSRVTHIVVGLPPNIREKLSRNETTTYGKLMIELNQLESSVSRKNAKPNFGQTGKTEGTEKRKPCSICDKLNKPGRFHPEKDCYFKNQSLNRSKTFGALTSSPSSLNKNIKIANNTELETTFNEQIDTKN